VEQRATFNAIAGLYAAARPAYPEALIDGVIGFAGLTTADSILEVGCGAGQATAQFAKHADWLLAIDPGEALIAAARERTAGLSNVAFVASTFESFDAPAGTFKLVFAAQAWHWIPPHLAFPKAATLLGDGGTLAVFGHIPMNAPEPLRTVFEQIYRHHTGRWAPPPEAAYLPSGPFPHLFDASRCFGPVTHRRYVWTWHHTSSSFADFLRTRSDHQLMQPEQRELLITSLKAAVDALGGEFDWPYETHLYLAKTK
jgi:SAM-dependent methyltransferase